MAFLGAAPAGIVGAFGGNGSPATHMARLGDFVFALDTLAFDELRRRTSFDWQAMRRVGRKSAHQYVGEGDDEIALPGLLYPGFKGSIRQIDALRAMAALGLPYRLMYDYTGASSDAGLWVITGVEETRKVLMRDGAPRLVDFIISLRSYGEDAAAATKNVGNTASLTSAKAFKLVEEAPPALLSVSEIVSMEPLNLAALNAAKSAALVMPSFAVSPAAAPAALSNLAASGAAMLSSARQSLSAGLSRLAPFAPPGSLSPISRAVGAAQSALSTLEGVGRPASNREDITQVADRIAGAASGALGGIRDAVAAMVRVERVTSGVFSATNSPQAAASLPAVAAMNQTVTTMLSGTGLIADTATAIKGRL